MSVAAIIVSLVPRPSTPPVFDRLQYTPPVFDTSSFLTPPVSTPPVSTPPVFDRLQYASDQKLEV